MITDHLRGLTLKPIGRDIYAAPVVLVLAGQAKLGWGVGWLPSGKCLVAHLDEGEGSFCLPTVRPLVAYPHRIRKVVSPPEGFEVGFEMPAWAEGWAA